MSGARTLQRGLEVLDAIRAAEAALSVSALARATGLDRAVISRLLPPLVDSGYVVMQGSPPKYEVGPRLAVEKVEGDSRTESWDWGSFEGGWSGDSGEQRVGESRINLFEEAMGVSEDEPMALVESEGRFSDEEMHDALASFMSFAAGNLLANIAQQGFSSDVPEFFIEMMGDVDVATLGAELDGAWSVRHRLREVDPVVAFQVFLAELDHREKDILGGRFTANPETLEALAVPLALTRERVRQISKDLRRTFEGRLSLNTLMVERVAAARRAIGGLVDMRELRSVLCAALPMIERLPAEFDEPFFFLLQPDGAFSRLARGVHWFVDADMRGRLTDAAQHALQEGLPLEAFHEAVPELRDLNGLSELLAAIGLKEVGGDVVGRKVSMNELAVRVLRKAGEPLAFDDIVDILEVGDRVRGLRNALLGDARIVRVDREVFALAEWGLAEYSTVRELMRQDLEAAGGEAPVADIVARLTARFDVKAASVVAYSRSAEFVRVAPGVIRLRLEDEPIEDVERPLDALRGCIRVGRRWAYRIEVTPSLLRGFSVQLPAGLAPHFGVAAGESEALPTDRSGQVSVIRRGIQDNMGRLRWVAEELGLVEGDMLLVLLPERTGGRLSFSSVRRVELEIADAPRRAGLLLGQDADLSLEIARKALGMPRGTKPSEVTAKLRARSEDELAALVGEVLGEGSVTDVDTRDIARMLGL